MNARIYACMHVRKARPRVCDYTARYSIACTTTQQQSIWMLVWPRTEASAFQIIVITLQNRSFTRTYAHISIEEHFEQPVWPCDRDSPHDDIRAWYRQDPEIEHPAFTGALTDIAGGPPSGCTVYDSPVERSGGNPVGCTSFDGPVGRTHLWTEHEDGAKLCVWLCVCKCVCCLPHMMTSIWDLYVKACIHKFVWLS